MNPKYIYIQGQLRGPLEMEEPDPFKLRRFYSEDMTSKVFAERRLSYEKHIASLPIIELSPTPVHNWIEGQVLEEGKDFRFKDLKGVCLDFDEPEPYVAIPIKRVEK